ncbi:MAG TPA: YraN family protein [Thermodesulfovibrionales bacterium]|nr:YraN family protein [Thermodesulfovibrionales bacterium]
MRPLGVEGEDLAADFLKGKGYRIIARNYKTPIGEIDIIARDRGTLVFAEVKTRAVGSFGHPFESVTPRKREKLRKLALYYLKNVCKKEVPSRFDVLSIRAGSSEDEIEHIVDAFE